MSLTFKKSLLQSALSALLLGMAMSASLAQAAPYQLRIPSLGLRVAEVSPDIASGQTGYAVWDSAAKEYNLVITNGLNVTTSGGCTPDCPAGYGTVKATLGKSSGKWYWEVTQEGPAATWYVAGCGIAPANGGVNRVPGYDMAGGYGFTDTANTTGVVFGCELDMTNNTFAWTKNGVLQSSVSVAPGTYYPTVSAYSTDSLTANFGQKSFVYPVPTGFNSGVK